MNTRTKKEIEHFSKLEHIWWGAKTHAGQKRYDIRAKLFTKIFNPLKGKKVLEIGAGDGEFTKRIVKTGADIIATDVTPAVVARGKKNLKYKNLQFKVADAEKLEYKDNFFDVACGVSILHHVNAQKALKELRRVLKPGGALFFSEPNLLNPQTFVSLKFPFLREKMEYSPDEKPFLRWEMVKMLKKAGFKTVAVYNRDFLHPLVPKSAIRTVQIIGYVLERTPIVKEISGSLIIYAQK